MSNCKLCSWLKGLFAKKCHCEEKGCDCQTEESVVNQETSSVVENQEQETVGTEEATVQENPITESTEEN